MGNRVTIEQPQSTPTNRTVGLTRKVAKGVGWFLGSTSCLMFLSFLTQWALGWWLRDEEFGVYAIALSCTALLQVFRDGGIALWLARQSPEAFDRNRAAAFWISIGASLFVASILALAAPWMATFYESSDVGKLVLLLGLATPFQALGVVPEARLQVEMRFRELASLRTMSGALRYVLTITFACFGFGPYSFAWPLFAMVIPSAIAFRLTRISPWHLISTWRECWAAFRNSYWAMLGSLASVGSRQLDKVVLGALASKSVVGVYFFAYQLAMQPGLLITQTIRKVFMPAYAAAGNDQSRQRRAAMQGASFLGLVVAPSILLLVLLAEAIETFLWSGKWAAAVPSIRYLAAVVPLHIFSLFARILIQSSGEFRKWTNIVALRGLSIAAAVIFACQIGGDRAPSIVAFTVATTIGLGAMVESAVMLRHLGLPAWQVTSAFLTPYLIASLVAGVAFAIGQSAESQRTSAGLTFAAFALLLLPTLWFCFRSQVWELVDVGRRAAGLQKADAI